LVDPLPNLRMTDEWKWNAGTLILTGEKTGAETCVRVPLGQPQIPHWPAWEQICASAARKNNILIKDKNSYDLLVLPVCQ